MVMPYGERGLSTAQAGGRALHAGLGADSFGLGWIYKNVRS